jgi:hypothetical protein
MSTAAQIAANQANSQLSTGPRTEPGKAAVRLNATRHGLTSKTIILPGESEEEFRNLEQSFLTDLKPANDTERALVTRVVENYWRLQRLYRAEADFFQAAESSLDIRGIGELFSSQSGSARASLFLRYLTSAERAYNRSLADLRQVQTQRRKEAAETAKQKHIDDLTAVWSSGVNKPARVIGSVSQKAASAPEVPAKADVAAPAPGRE